MSAAQGGHAPVKVKICGLSTAETVQAALDAGANMVGFVFVEASPRQPGQGCGLLQGDVARGRAEIVALLVDPDDARIAEVMAEVRPDVLQFHGRETHGRLAAVRGVFDVPVIKAIGVTTRDDLQQMDDFHVDRILLDAKPPKDAAYPGGHGRPFDWSILDGMIHPNGFILSGGLTPGNVADAIRRVRPWAVDVSSGVERAPGVKDVGLIRDFIARARAA
jgi:phosphoribosylanthranilate isomerase